MSSFFFCFSFPSGEFYRSQEAQPARCRLLQTHRVASRHSLSREWRGLWHVSSWRPGLESIFRGCLEVKALTLLTLLAPVSVFWSQQPLNSVRRGTFLFLTTLFAVYLVRRFKPVDLAQMLVLTGVVVGLLSIAVSIGVPAVGRDVPKWRGLAGGIRLKKRLRAIYDFLPQPGNLLSFFPAQHKAAVLCALLHCCCAHNHVESQDGMAPLSCAYPVHRLAFSVEEGSSKSARFLAFATLGLVGILALALPLPGGDILQMLGKESTLSGRIPLWAGVLQQFPNALCWGMAMMRFGVKA